MNRKKQLLSVFLGAAMLCCTACNSQGQTAASGTPQSISSTQNTAVSQYDGPLYELSFTNINDILPEFMSFYRSNVDSTANGEYYGIEFMTNFTLEDTITIGPHTYCDANLNFLPVGENRSFLDYYNGYRMFLWMNPDGEIRDGWALEVYDKDLNLVTTTADNYEIFCFEGGYIYLKTGWIPVQEKSTSLEGFLIYTLTNGIPFPLHPRACKMVGMPWALLTVPATIPMAWPMLPLPKAAEFTAPVLTLSCPNTKF